MCKLKPNDAPWLYGWENDIPCQFDLSEAKNNCAILLETLGTSWIEKRINRDYSSSHPIIKAWRNNGMTSFLRLNVLANDLYLIRDKPYFEHVLADFKKNERTKAAEAVIHLSAIFERAKKNTLEQFYPSKDKKVPDFLLNISDTSIPVEVKQLEESQLQINFGEYAKKVEVEIKRLLQKQNDSHIDLCILIKNVESRPPIDQILLSIRKTLEYSHNHNDQACEVRSSEFNVFMSNIRTPPSFKIENYFRIMLFSPKDLKEDLRVRDRVLTV